VTAPLPAKEMADAAGCVFEARRMAIDSVTNAGGYCLVEDVFYLPHSVERDFCLFRSDELGNMFRLLGWDVWDAPCWTQGGAIPYSFVLARKKGCVPHRSRMRCGMARIHAQVKRRMRSRLDAILDAWQYRAMFPNEIREHLYTLYGLSNFARWEHKMGRTVRTVT